VFDEILELSEQPKTLQDRSLEYEFFPQSYDIFSWFEQQNKSIELVLDNKGNLVNNPTIESIFDWFYDSIDLTSENGLAPLILLVPLVGFVFIRTENSEFKFYSFRKISSLALSFILLSSAVSIPLSISDVYAQYAPSDSNQDYKILNINFPNKIYDFTVSAWVKPDYSDGSSEFTVVSKENAFVLSINKLVSPEKVAKFSIYDGIKWHTVESTLQIPENWAHLAATFGNSEIKIYVNGKLESTLSDIEVMSLDARGNIVMGPVSMISSNGEIIAGAYTFYRNNQLNVINQFSGDYYDIDLFAFVADQKQIDELYLGSFELEEFGEGVVLVSSSTTGKNLVKV